MKCHVLAPVAFTHNGEGVSCTTVGAVVEVDDGEAKALIAEGKLAPVKEPKPAAEVKTTKVGS